VPVHERHVLAQVEHDPVHPAHDQAVEGAEGRARLLQRVQLDLLAEDLDGHGRDVEVGFVLEGGAGLAGFGELMTREAGDAVAAASDRLHPMREAVVDAQALELSQPGVDPHVVRGALQHTVHLPAWLGHVL
jgi:hypothetical protein